MLHVLLYFLTCFVCLNDYMDIRRTGVEGIGMEHILAVLAGRSGRADDCLT
jgi:hypothetical protein